MVAWGGGDDSGLATIGSIQVGGRDITVTGKPEPQVHGP
jgi:hypothetical protein